jgi:hypothetical protein
MEHRKPKRIKLLNTAERPLSEKAIVDATVAFANGDSLDIQGLVPRGILPRADRVGDKAIEEAIELRSALREKNIEFGDDDGIKTIGEYWDQMRQGVRSTLSVFVENPLAASRAVLKSGMVEVVSVKPVLREAAGGLELALHYEFMASPDLVHLGVLLLLDVHRGFGKKLCQCQWEPCGLLFFEIQPATGRPQRKYCCSEHMLQAHDQNAAKRMKRRRRAPAGKK